MFNFKKKSEEIVPCTMLFGGNEEQARSFLKEYIDNFNVVLYNIEPIDVVNEKTKAYVKSGVAVKCFTTRINLEKFQKEFGQYIHISEGW